MSSLVRRGRDHQDKALLRRRELRNIVARMGPTDVLLHGAVALLLKGSMIVRCEDQDNEPGRRAKEPLSFDLSSPLVFEDCWSIAYCCNEANVHKVGRPKET